MGVEALTLGQIGAQGALGVAQSVSSTSAIGRGMEYGMNAAMPNRFPDPADLILMRMRGTLDDAKYTQIMRLHGFDSDKAAILYRTALQQTGIVENITLLWRKKIDLNQFYERAENLGVPVNVAKDLLTVSEYIPSIQDVIRFAVREVYSESASQLGLFQDYPGEQFTEAAAAVGMSEEVARLHWAAHWQLPSPNQVYEMLHRRLITIEEVDEYLKAADYSPVWREKLRKISYNTYTRVDVRRMYKIGALTEQEVFEAYLDGGYDEEHAKNLTEFTIQDVSEEDNGLTKALIISSYKKGLVDRSTADGYLSRIYKSRDVIELVLQVADYEIMLDELDAAEDALTEAFLNGTMTLDGVRVEMHKYDVSETYVRKFTNKLSLQLSRKSKRPSVADLKRWLTNNLITREDFIARLVRYGYDRIDAGLYASETNTDTKMGG